MKNKLFILLMLGFLVLLPGCLKEETCTSGSSVGPIQITLSIGDPEHIQTRSTASINECSIDNLTILIFDASTGKYKDGEYIVDGSGLISGSNGDVVRLVTLNRVPAPGDKLVVLANSGIENIPLIPGVSTVDEINQFYALPRLKDLNPADNSIGLNLPMSGDAIYNLGGTVPIPLRRSVAKIQLTLADELIAQTSSVVSFNMCNLMVSEVGGTFYTPQGAEASMRDGLTDGDFTNLGVDRWISDDRNNGAPVFENTYYMAEFPNATNAKTQAVDSETFSVNRTCMIVASRGLGGYAEGYYRLDLYDHALQQFIDIRRNTHIVVKITKVKSAGYASIAEALANPGSNLEYEIIVTDNNDNVVVSNGQYAIAVSETVVDIFGDAGEYDITSAHYILPAEITALPSGITNNITISGNNIALVGNIALTGTAAPIRIKVIKPTGSAQLTIKLGNMQQTISITLHDDPTDAHVAKRNIDLTQLVGHDIKQIRWNRNDNNIQAELIPSDNAVNLQLIFPENMTPVGWVDDQQAPASQADPSSVPLFEDKIADISCFGEGLNGGTSYRRLIFKQLGPDYVGWWGGEPAGAVAGSPGMTYFSKRLIVERLEETTPIIWYSSNVATGPMDIERGFANTQSLMEKTDRTDFAAAYYCYMKNDLNLDGVVSSNEPFLWYLPSKTQLLALYTLSGGFKSPLTGEEYTGYWSSTQEKLFGRVWSISGLTGNMDVVRNKTGKSYVRCVKEM